MDTDCAFLQFCQYVDESIFSEENRGDVVRFVVDDDFMRQFCQKSGFSESEVMEGASRRRSVVNEDILEVKGFLAIQTYAACKRSSGKGYSARNFRVQLSRLLGWSTYAELQPWMVEFQDNVWGQLFQWCEANDYVIPTCRRKTGIGRYTQYPLRQAQGVFTTEELRYIAQAFVDKGLHPDDDLTYEELWEEIRWEEMDKYLYSLHAKRLYAEPDFRADAQRQIHGYFNRWDGTYLQKKRSGSVSKKTEVTGRMFSMDEELEWLIVADKNMNHPQRYRLHDLTQYTCPHCMGGRKQWIAFRRDEFYGDWQEVHRLEQGEEGRVLIWKNWASVLPHGVEPLRRYEGCNVYRVTPADDRWKSLYASVRPYQLVGGLRIDRDSYLLGGAPVLRIEGTLSFWVDNERKEDVEGDYDLNHLGAGQHTIRIRGFKPVVINIRPVTCPIVAIDATAGGWQISRRRGKVAWDYDDIQGGILGMDFASVGIKQGWASNGIERPVLETWARLHHGLTAESSDNIVINTLKNIREHERF